MMAINIIRTEKKWQFWIDRGGTFTDVVALAPDGEIHTYKLLSDNPEQYKDAALEGMRQVLQLPDTDSLANQKIESVKMGTTIATNALLEHRGEPTLFVTTQGFADALRIGYQNRPRLFDLNIQLPEPFYARVMEVEERVDAHGHVLIPLNVDTARRDLKAAYAEGFRAIAIVLMHSYRFFDHELQLEKCAQEIGFDQISISHQVSPLMRFIQRGNTTVVDAYLSPIIRAYVEGISKELKKTTVYFMQSNGGLAEAHRFTGKNSIFSGPAAGVVGAIKTATTAGFHKIISFDMGGTSTDVAHYCGEMERTETLKIAGINLQAPMIKIHTIAAGGGSILHFRQGRYQVGPDSAAANPGPSCYRRGGPLTVTDANVMLGRIQAEHFPNMFGELADQAIDTRIVSERFVTLSNDIAQETGEKKTPEEIASGFLHVAVHNMANAIKKISVERGYDVTQYALCCFGGAGGQHACAVADALNIQTIFIHPYAGVLSAYGMGLAELRVLKEKAIETFLDKTSLFSLEDHFQQLMQTGKREMAQQGIVSSEITLEKTVRLRYHGTDTPLDVDYHKSVGQMQHTFEEKHRQEFAYIMPEKAITIESILLEMVGEVRSLDSVTTTRKQQDRSAKPLAYVNAFFGNDYVKTPLYDLTLSSGLRSNTRGSIEGPAIIIEKNSTTIIEPDWQAVLQADGGLVLQRTKLLGKHTSIVPDADPVMLEIFNKLFMSIAEQMGVALAKTAYSVNIKERQDFSCAIFDKQGHLVANAPHIPVHLGSMSESVQTIIRKRGDTVLSGDVYMLNDPYHGGTHLPDITLITPVFVEDSDQKTPVFFVASRAHHADVGGITPGSIPASSQRIEEEGVLIDNFTLVREGVFQEASVLEKLNVAPYPVRNNAQNIADLKAQIAANQKGVNELLQLLAQYGLSVVEAYMQHIQDNAEACVREAIDQLHNGAFRYAMDNGSCIEVSVKRNPKDRSAVIDFTGTSPQRANNFNAPKSVCYAAVLYVFRTVIKVDIPLNYGCFKPLTIIIPKNSVLDPKYPAAIVAGNVETSQCIVDALYGALDVMAASQGTMNNVTFGNNQYQYYETICGGSGAGPGFNGASAVHTHMTNSLLTDPEILEHRFPVLLESFAVRNGSGGGGHWRGGDGVIRKLKFLETMQAAIVSNRRIVPPYGMAGGGSAMPGKNYIQRIDGHIEVLDSTAEVLLNPGDIFVIETPGGGGYGE